MGAAPVSRTSASPVSRPILQRLVHKSVHNSGCWPGASPHWRSLPSGCQHSGL